MTTVTVRLQDAGLTQSELQEQLDRLVGTVAEKCDVKAPIVEAVYPGDENGRWKRTFVVKFDDHGGKVFADNLNKMPGVELAYVAPSRG